MVQMYFYLVFLALVSLSVIKGTNTTSCNYSIGLLDFYGDGWNGNTASVLVNNFSLLKGITIASGYSATFNFTVTSGANIDVIYTPSGRYQYENSYIVFTSANGAGNWAYSSIPYYTSITNPCQSDTCSYSVKIEKLASTSNFSLYVNNDAKIYNAFLSDPFNVESLTISFNVSKDDLIVGLISFPNQNYYRYNTYSLYTESDASGTVFFDWKDYVFSLNGPKTPATIPNFCGVQALQLTVTLGPIVAGNASIPVAVVPSPLAQNNFATNLTLFCNNGSTQTVQNRLTSQTAGDFFYFDAPSSDLQGCYFIASSDDINYPWLASPQVPVPVTCGYSIELLDGYGDGWNENTASVLVNNVAVLSDITLESDYSAAFNFPVTSGANISVIYTPSGSDQTENYYNVFASANGAGIRALSSIPYYTSITNPCQSDTCSCSVEITKNDPITSSNFSLYVNNEAIIYNALLPAEGVDSLIINFNVSKGDLIVGLIYFSNYFYQGDFNNYYVLQYTDGPEFFNWQDYVNSFDGPKTPATIPNFCGVQALQLTVTLGPIVAGNASIPVAVVPSPLAQNNFATNLTLFCNDGSTQTVQNRLTSQTAGDFFYFDAPSSDLQGCYFIASSDDINYPWLASPQVPVPVTTQILSFSMPTTGSVIALTTASFPVKLVTSGANVYDNITVSFQCDGGPATTSNFTANTDSLTQSVSPSQIGPCSLTITSAPPGLVYPTPSVYFTLKYSLTFANLPAILYRGQAFTIRIDTVTPASTPPSVTLELICPSGLVGGTWSGVVINQENNLVLSSDVPLESCYFNVNSGATYTQATSSDVPVSKVPVSVSLPSGPGPFPKPHAVPLLVDTTVTPVNGTVNLQSTCSSLTAPFAVSIPINTLGSFSYPQNAYGVCNLTVVDEVFEQLPTYIL